MKYTAPIFFLLITFCLYLTNAKAQQVKRTKQPEWVTPQNFNAEAKPDENQETSYYYLLLDEQEHIGEQEQFTHYAYKILSADGVQQMADLSISFDPSYEEIKWHQITIHRNGERIDQMPMHFNIIQRETSADRYLYDGSKTVIINLSDIRIGDIIEYSFTRKGYNPIYGKNIARAFQVAYTFSFEKSYNRMIVPSNFTLNWKYENTDLRVKKEQINNTVRYIWEAERPMPVVYYSNEPNWFDIAPKIYCSTFTSWEEVSAWAQPLFQWNKSDLTLLEKEAAKEIQADNVDQYVTEAINFVQDKVRYLGFESGINSHKPHAPSQVWQQRFGDCKDKSLLLVALLQLKNIEAYPLLVNTRLNKEVVNKIPSHTLFNHCIVWYNYKGQTKIVDPTINNQGGNWQSRYWPNYAYGLIVSSDPKTLTKLPLAEGGKIVEVQKIDIAGIDAEAKLSVNTTYTGHEADFQRSYFANNSKETIQKNYLTFYGNLYPDVQKFGELKWTDNRKENIFTISEEYKVTDFWLPHQTQEGKIYCEFYPQVLENYFNVQKSNNRKAPYQLTYPLNYSHTIEVHLPESWPVETSDLKINSEYYKYNYSIDYDDLLITIKTDYQTLQEAVPVDFIKNFVDDHIKMMGNLSYTLQFDQNIQSTINNPIYGIILNIVCIVGGAWLMFFIYRSFDPVAQESLKWKRSIGGWLVLPAVGLCLTPFRLIYQFLTEDYLLDGTVWVSHYLSGNFFIASFVLAEQIYNLLFFLFSILLIILFFQQRTSLPMLMIVFYSSNALVSVADTIFVYWVDPTSNLEMRDLFTRVLSAMIWIPYFIYSERVKETFIHTLKPLNENQEDKKEVLN